MGHCAYEKMRDGAGGSFRMDVVPGGSEISSRDFYNRTWRALLSKAACESHYGRGNCGSGSCGFGNVKVDYYTVRDRTLMGCNCDDMRIGTYEWVYHNYGMSNVGEDYYNLVATYRNVTGKHRFVRRRVGTGCQVTVTWNLTLVDYGGTSLPVHVYTSRNMSPCDGITTNL